MIDLDFVCSNEWSQYCLTQYNNLSGPECWLHGNYKFNVEHHSLVEPENFYQDKHGYSKPKNNLSDSAVLDVYNYKQNENLTLEIKHMLEFKAINMCLQVQHPGNIVPVHIDRNRTILGKIISDKDRQTLDYSNLKRYIYFIQDQQLGQFFQIGKTQLSWTAGDLYEFYHYIPHATANASLHSRSILTIDGIKA